ncbi:ubiquitin carboxyl-terminal hydrolase 2, putative [Plasmodium vivax]|uniref:Ubiquitin carboxyl-terminal hydrolase 2, putative n=1 Tax=Plasmodium vivax (strain Salvador I) TaxID=126793 RepID=A5K9J2_PLAVS|nr:ubiquitin carboxyl-terminal hydrolase 2, putative [Plasmodium vivax]EDL44064.1 ubiquitin carboxyl-terminal hydrolase 2, putative [Plasmodium vivax]|eukprot:XP_001613791.1 ubiquitin carboxyl-terminal hydrolase 2 [Plasmodium vivax Sal-1]
MDSPRPPNSPSKNLTLDKIQILNLFKLFDNLPFDPKSENETWHIVNKEFIDSLRSYEEGKASRYDALINNKIFVEDASNVTTRTRLLKEYENGNGVSFLLYPEKAIEVLEKHFHFNLKIPRAVYPYKVPKRERVIYKVDVQPLKLVVYSKNPNEFSSPSKMKIVVLRNDTVEDLLKEIVTDFDPASFKKNLFYAEEVGGKREYNWERLYLQDSTEFPLKRRIHEYEIDERTCLLITNERADIKCLTNESDYGYTRREASFRRSEKEEDCMRGYSSGRAGAYGGGSSTPQAQGHTQGNAHGNAQGHTQGHTQGYPQQSVAKQISYIFEHGGDRGLVNLGNTCFLNSSLQCLAKIRNFSNYFLSGTFWNHINYSNPVGQHGRLAKAYYETLLELWKIDKRSEPYAPKVLKQAISEKRDEFYGYQQHDSQELLAFLLDGLHEDLNLIQKKPYYEEKLQGGLDKQDIDVAEASWNRHKEINNSIIVDLFQGQYRSRLQCPKCKKVSIAFDPFMYLSIPLPPKKNHRIWFHVILNRDFPIGMRFSCSFSGSQEVLKLKIFVLTIIKNLKGKRKNILLHNKCIIKNSKDTSPEGRSSHANVITTSSSSGSSCGGGGNSSTNNAFNFHYKYLDEKNEFYEDNEDNCTSADIANYVRAIKNKSKITSTLKEQDISTVHESICAMCNIQSIDELEINNLSFLFTKFKNLACNQFFQVLNNSDFVTEPHTRNGKGISHIFVFILPKLCSHLIDKNMEVKVGDESLEVLTNSTVTTNNTSLRDEELNGKGDPNGGAGTSGGSGISGNSGNGNCSAEKKPLKGKNSHASKILKKRKGVLGSPSSNGSPVRKGEKTHPSGAEEDEDDELTPGAAPPAGWTGSSRPNVSSNAAEPCDEAMEESNDINMQETCSEAPLNDSNGMSKSRPSCEPHISYNELFRDRILINQDVHSLHDKYFSLLIVPLCKDEQLFYKMKNNDLPLLFNVPFNFTLNDLYGKVENAYRKTPPGGRTARGAATSSTPTSSGQGSQAEHADRYGPPNAHNGNGRRGEEDEIAKKDSISSGDVANKTTTSEYNRVEEEEKGGPSGAHEGETPHSRITLYLPCYNLKEEWTSKENLGLELKRDETYLSDYIKNSEEKRLIIIHLNSGGIDHELSLDIKTITFVDLEERYGIDTCLKLFSEEEHLDENNTWYCGNCKLHVQAYKKLDLFRMPIILILHLKRFNNTNRWLRTKIDSYVYYPHKENEYLNMTPYILEDGLKHMMQMDPHYSPLYELIGVNCHTGGLCGGHYFAYVKLNGQWYNFNDTFVTTIDESQVNTKNAYLLFYQLHTHKNETFTGVADQRNLAEEEAIRMANASYYN